MKSNIYKEIVNRIREIAELNIKVNQSALEACKKYGKNIEFFKGEIDASQRIIGHIDMVLSDIKDGFSPYL